MKSGIAVRKRRLIVSAAVCLLTLCVVVLVMARLQGGKFDAVVTLGSETPVKCEGDTDIVSVESLVGEFGSVHPAGYITVRFRTEKALAFTSGHYSEGRLIEGENVSISVERLDGDKWIQLYAGNVKSGALYEDEPPFRGLYPDQPNSLTADIFFPFHPEAGKYRITYFFRDYVREDFGSYSTGDKLYSISHTLDIPSPGSKPLDLLAVRSFSGAGEPVSSEDIGEDVPLSVFVRSNDAEELFAVGARLEMAGADGGVIASEPSVESFQSSRCTFNLSDEESIYVVNLNCFFPDRTREYYLTLDFAKNEDGSGELYTLRLKINYDGQ